MRVAGGEQRCDCHPGYTLSEDGRTCDDVDECEVTLHVPCSTRDTRGMLQVNNGGCDQLCHNRPGTFMCEVSGSVDSVAVMTPPPQCSPGYSGSITCLDVNECLLNNGHGPCQDSCTNTHGGYEAGHHRHPAIDDIVAAQH